MTSEEKACTVLIADDDLSLIQALCRRLRSRNFNIIVAADGYQAVQLTREYAPDVVVLDVNMPAGDGFSVHDRISQIPGVGHTPVIYITGEQTPRVYSETKKAGAFAVLYKPFDAEDLAEAIVSASAGEAA